MRSQRIGIMAVMLLITITAMTYTEARASQPGSFMRVGSHVSNLTSVDGEEISFEPVYSPKTYSMIYDANGGIFSDGEDSLKSSVVYNDGSRIYDSLNTEGGHTKENKSFITLPEEPVYEEHSFICWYLEGNDVPDDPGPDDGVIIKNGSRYMIANDEPDDLEKTRHTSDGSTIAVALWRANDFSYDDGNEADPGFDGGGQGDEDDGWTPLPGEDEGSGEDEGEEGGNPDEDEDGDGDDEGPDGGGDDGPGGSGSQSSTDLWDEGHVNNHAVEFVEGYEDKAAYESRFGDIKYQYRRIVFNAETEFAGGYSWFRKKAGEDGYESLGSGEETYKADRLTREDDGDIYRCEVDMGMNGEKLIYETAISVYWLPAIDGIETEILA